MKLFTRSALIAVAAISVAAPAFAAEIPDGGLTFSDTVSPNITLNTAPTFSTVNFNDVTIEFVGTGGFSNAGSFKLGRLNGLVSFLSTPGDTETYNLPDLFVFNDGASGSFHFSSTSVTTQSFVSNPSSFALLFLGTTSDANLGYTDTATSMQLTFSKTGVSSWQASGSLSVPPASDVPEPASWAMMVGGFGLLGGALRRKRTTIVSFG